MTWVAEHFDRLFVAALVLNFTYVGCFFGMVLRRRQVEGETGATFGNLLSGKVEWDGLKEFRHLASGDHRTAGDAILSRLVWATRLILAPAFVLMLSLFAVAFSGKFDVR